MLWKASSAGLKWVRLLLDTVFDVGGIALFFHMCCDILLGSVARNLSSEHHFPDAKGRSGSLGMVFTLLYLLNCIYRIVNEAGDTNN